MIDHSTNTHYVEVRLQGANLRSKWVKEKRRHSKTLRVHCEQNGVLLICKKHCVQLFKLRIIEEKRLNTKIRTYLRLIRLKFKEATYGCLVSGKPVIPE